ncbi:sugar ABC transporter ATP-binding protein [Hespellia stercorisuis]|uniref:Ribose transport system ATP-binding protein n=1 Tax=Hespellia stercorisuis DSM 15480 TaxID=1121950 RepID=A0A1M6SM34_9FIRM|nr:sugar ABC transporter ATP-binding protein [Hespellia stercorisuis]SHK45638.1 ribose transport system ATP-binding protein [Hespellia stercorisuis DSM 15480]
MQDTILKIEHISKIYPGVTALNDVSFEIKKGEIRALVGENGAGKSTLIKCIMGVEKPEKGTISMNYNGEWVVNENALEAQNHGVYANYQNVNIAPDLSIAENYFLGKPPTTKLGSVDWKKMQQDSQVIVDKFDMKVDPLDKIRNLPIAMQAMVTISKISVNEDIRLVIFDEPTALLENEKVDTLFKFIKELKEKGVSIIYISHRLEEIMDICDSVTILKDGTYVDTKPIEEVTKDSLITMMVGREMSDIYNIEHQKIGKEILRVENFSDTKNFKNINFKLHAGEILGFVGLVGAGRSEIMRALCGVEKRLTGDIYIKGEKVSIKNPGDAMDHRISFLTEDRRADGLALHLPIKTNINMNSYDMISKAGFISLKKEDERANDFSKRVNVKTPSVMQLVGNLSGGNQQKVVIAKLLCCNPDILIFDEPTVGVDVGAKEEIYKIVERLAAKGKGIILISSYLPEVMGLADHLIVMAQGQITGEFNKEELASLKEEDVLRKASIEG